MRRLSTILVVIVCVILATVIIPGKAYAIDPPDTAPAVNAVYVYDLEDGGIGVLVDYYLDYAALPSETATESFMAVFIDTDGTTQLKSVAPYTYQDSGYGRGLIWIQFTSAEVATLSIDSTDVALYRVWLVGNPTLTWTGGVVPKTIATIDQWNTTGDMPVLLALRVLYYADQLELIWSLDLIEETALGSRLTTLGESYFVNVIPQLHTLAPAVFSAGTVDPTLESIDYTTSYGAVATSGTVTTVAGSPYTIIEDGDTITVGGALGTFTITLTKGTEGTIEDDTGLITVSPTTLAAGVNTITVTGLGDLTVTVALVNTETTMEDTILGTGLDLTAIATIFSMSRAFFSGIVWILVTIIVCAGYYRSSSGRDTYIGEGGGGGKGVLLIFDICVIGGAVLGLLTTLVAVLMFIGFGALTGFVLFFKNANV